MCTVRIMIVTISKDFVWIKQNNPGKPFGRVYEIVQPLRTISDEFYYSTLYNKRQLLDLNSGY